MLIQIFEISKISKISIFSKIRIRNILKFIPDMCFDGEYLRAKFYQNRLVNVKVSTEKVKKVLYFKYLRSRKLLVLKIQKSYFQEPVT